MSTQTASKPTPPGSSQRPCLSARRVDPGLKVLTKEEPGTVAVSPVACGPCPVAAGLTRISPAPHMAAPHLSARLAPLAPPTPTPAAAG